MPRTLVTGARAKTGAPLIDLLRQRPDVEVLAGSSNPARLDPDGVVPTRFDWDEPDTWAGAVRDIDALFVVRPDREDAPALIGGLLEQTPRHTRVVLLSEVDEGYFPDDAWARVVERTVIDSGRSWTILRPGWFMQVFTDPRFFRDEIVSNGRLPFPSEGRSVAWIDTRDIAAVAERALLEDGHAGRTYEITGPESLTLRQTADLLAESTGRPVQHVELTMDEALGDSEGFARANDYGAFDRIRKGMAGTVSDTVQAVTGRPPTNVRDFLHDHAAELSAGPRSS